MLGHRGKTWLSASVWLLIIAAALWPAAALATMPAPNAFPAPFLVVSAQTFPRGQIMGERPVPAASTYLPSQPAGNQPRLRGQWERRLAAPQRIFAFLSVTTAKILRVGRNVSPNPRFCSIIPWIIACPPSSGRVKWLPLSIPRRSAESAAAKKRPVSPGLWAPASSTIWAAGALPFRVR